MLLPESINEDKKEDLEDVAYSCIISMILKNQIRPGESILETELAKTLNVSRTPVRQALGRLIAEGLLEKKRKKGCVIPFPTPEGAQQVFEARKILETEAVRTAARNASQKDIKKLGLILDAEANALSTYNKEAYWLANEKYHFGIMKAAKNIYIERYCRHIFRMSSMYIFFFDSFYTRTNKLNIPPRQKSPIQHIQILDAIEKGEQDTAAELMKEHIQYSLEVLIGI